jgi:4-alpha-glucanotransferase
MASDRYGIDDRYHDAQGVEHLTSPETRAALMAAMGIAPQSDAPPTAADVASEDNSIRLMVPGGGIDRTLAGPADLVLEDGTTVAVDAALPATLPYGYHHLLPRDGREQTLLIVSPGRCFLPEHLRTWGFAAQLYAARSRASWGIGDLADMARLGRWTRRLGGGALMVNPLTAPTPVAPIEPSPYYPSSRRFRNPLYLHIEDIPGWSDLPAADRDRLANAGRALNAGTRIDRDAIFRIKLEALVALHGGFRGDPDFDAFRAEQGDALTDFATYCTLAEQHGKDWRGWPAGFRRHDGADVARFRADNHVRVGFHAWVQWRLDQQLARASGEIAVVHDLPIGLDIAGADAWCWQDFMAAGVSVGAPPDEFNASGQDWGLTPFIPVRLRAAGYRPFIETIRAMLRHAGGLRIDHVMGLFRLFWIPRTLGAKGGTYVRSHADEMLAIVALESVRAKAFIVGEDLGTVEPGVRERLAEQRMLSYRLLYFEPTAPERFPELALSSVTTHDLPTIAGLWTGADIDAQKRIGLHPNEDGTRGLRNKLRDLGGLDEHAAPEQAIEATHRALARAPSRILLATLDDAVATPERPNMPGTINEWPNWSLPLPATLEDIEAAELPRHLAQLLARPPAGE